MLKSGRVLSAVPLPDLGLEIYERRGSVWEEHVRRDVCRDDRR
jgi:hypothetical protein